MAFNKHSAFFTLYESALRSKTLSELERINILNSMEETSTRITAFSKHLFGDEDLIGYSTMSPLVPYAQYQSAVVQYRLWKQTGKIRYKENMDSLKVILGFQSRRWMLAGELV